MTENVKTSSGYAKKLFFLERRNVGKGEYERKNYQRQIIRRKTVEYENSRRDQRQGLIFPVLFDCRYCAEDAVKYNEKSIQRDVGKKGEYRTPPEHKIRQFPKHEDKCSETPDIPNIFVGLAFECAAYHTATFLRNEENKVAKQHGQYRYETEYIYIHCDFINVHKKPQAAR